MASIVINTRDFEQTVAELIRRATNAQPALEAWGQHMVGSIKRNFQEQGRPTPWTPLKVNTLVARYMRGKTGGEKAGGRFAPNPKLYKQQGRLSGGSRDNRLQRYLGDTDSISTVPGMARSPKTGRVLRARHGGLNKFAPKGMVFRRPALRDILSGQILIDSRDLSKSISAQLNSPTEVVIGTNKEYAAPHQFGWPAKGIPDRPYIILQPDDEEEFAALLTEWVSGGGRFGGY